MTMFFEERAWCRPKVSIRVIIQKTVAGGNNPAPDRAKRWEGLRICVKN